MVRPIGIYRVTVQTMLIIFKTISNKKYKYENIPIYSIFTPHDVTLTFVSFKLTDPLVCPMKYSKGEDMAIDTKREQRRAILLFFMVICPPLGRHTLRYLSMAITNNIIADRAVEHQMKKYIHLHRSSHTNASR
jgi:hypothetical protein